MKPIIAIIQPHRLDRALPRVRTGNSGATAL
jgi:hypothetical protein